MGWMAGWLAGWLGVRLGGCMLDAWMYTEEETDVYTVFTCEFNVGI